MAQKKLQYKKLLSFWKKLLRLQDWEIEVKEMIPDAEQEHVGEVAFVLERKYAQISLLSPQATDEDIEDTLVHELIHIHLAPFWPEEDAQKVVLAEQAVDSLARAFVALRRIQKNG